MTGLEIFISIISSVLGGLAGGLFTFFGVNKTIKHEKSMKIREEEINAYEKRPRLEFLNRSDLIKFDFDENDYDLINAYVFLPYNLMELGPKYEEYSNKLNKENLVYRIIELKNIGDTEIESIYMENNYIDSVLMLPFFYRYNKLDKQAFVENRKLNYNYIKSGDSFKLIIVYNTNMVFSGILSPEISFIMKDINGRNWIQGLSFELEKTDNSERYK